MHVDSGHSLGAAPMPRPRLLRLMQRRWTHRVTVVSAGAGFGKTTLARQAAAENELSPLGSDIVFTFRPGSTAGALDGLAAAFGLPSASSNLPPTELAHAIADAMWKQAPLTVAAIFDDVHFAGPEAVEVLDELVRALPDNGRVVLLSRHPPAVSLGRAEAQGEVLRLGEDELRLTVEEQHELERSHGLPEGSLDAAGGWPALAVLAAATGTRVVRDFLWEEILGHLDEDDRRGLAGLVVVGAADEELLAEALGKTVDLDSLMRHVPLVDERPPGTYSAHALWSDHIAGVLSEDEQAGVRRRAAAVLEVRGDAPRAVELLVAAGDWERATRVMAAACHASHSGVAIDTARAWLALTRGEVPDHPVIPLLESVVLRAINPGDPACAPLLDRARRGFREIGDEKGEMAALAQRGYLAWIHQETDVLLELHARIAELAGGGDLEALALATLAEAVASDLTGDDEAMLEHLRRIPHGVLSSGWQEVADWFRARGLLARGQFEAAEEAARSAGESTVFLGWRLMPHHVAFYRGDVLTASKALESFVIPPDASARDREVVHHLRAIVRAFLGRPEEARAALVEARANQSNVVLRSRPFALVVAATVALAGGDENEAEALVRQLLDGGSPDTLSRSESHIRSFLALPYVLVPETRDYWDARPLPGATVTGHVLARALVAIRNDEAPDDVEALEALPVEHVLPWLPLRWAMEVAVGLCVHGGGSGLAEALLSLLGSPARRALRALGDHQDKRVGDTAKHLVGTLPVPPEEPLEIRVLGTPHVVRSGAIVEHPHWRRERVRLLLAFLVHHGAATREQVATALWPDFEPEASAKNLRTNLNHLQTILEPDRAPGEPTWFIRQEGGLLRLAVGDDVVIDAHVFDRLVDEGERADRDGMPSVAVTKLREAAALWRGDYLEDAAYEDWAIPERDRLRARFVAAAVRAGELLAAQGAAGEAIELATRVIESEPWSERAFRLLIAAHLARGDRAAARRALSRCRAMLADLGVEAEPETAVLARRLGAPPG